MRIAKYNVENDLAANMLVGEGFGTDVAEVETKLQELIVISEEIIFMIDHDSSYDIIERRVLAIVGLKAQKVVGRLVFKENMAYPDVLNKITRIFEGQHKNAASISEGKVYKEPYTHTLDGQGDVIDLFCISINISENNRADQQLRNSEEKYKNLIESTNDAVIGFDSTGRITSWNSRAERIFGYTQEEILGKSYSVLVPKELQTRRQELVSGLKKTGSVTTFESVRLTKENKLVPCEVTMIRNRKTKDGYAMVAVLRDISARKFKENELAESRSRLARTQQLFRMGSWEMNLTTDTTIWSEECCRIFGFEPNDNIRPNSEWFSYVHSDDLAFVKTKIRAGQNTMSDTTAYHRIVRKDGVIRHVYSEIKYVKDSNDVLTGMYGIVRDVTDANLADQKLRLLSAAVEQNPASIVITDPQGNINYVNAKFEEMSGLTSQEVMGKNTQILQSDRSDDDSTYADMWNTIVEGKAWTGEFKNSTKSGKVLWEKVSVGPIVNENGEVTDFVSVKEDITSIKATEEALRKTLLNMEKIVRQRTKKLVETTEELERINNDFMSSLEYAKRIQEAIIPSDKELSKVFKDVFTIYHPKDVISGDFYWYSANDREVIFALADCTGHGVPGALMSMAGHELLDSIVINRKVKRPDLVLTEMHKAMGHLLMRKDARFFMNDGMDMSVVHIDKVTGMFSYSGAHSHGLLVRKNEVIPLVPDRLSIGGRGGQSDATEFTEHQFPYLPGDKVYLFSDGFYDQFGGPNGKKMLRKYFTNLIINSSKQSMIRQHAFLEQSFANWKGTEEQIDDVCVVGLKL